MGLDQYAYARKGMTDPDNPEESIKLTQWRKYHDLEEWMANLYLSRGGTKEFNCVGLRLEEEDILRFARDYENESDNPNFYFDKSSEWKVEETEKFIDQALKYIKNGYTIIYSSWW